MCCPYQLQYAAHDITRRTQERVSVEHARGRRRAPQRCIHILVSSEEHACACSLFVGALGLATQNRCSCLAHAHHTTPHHTPAHSILIFNTGFTVVYAICVRWGCTLFGKTLVCTPSCGGNVSWKSLHWCNARAACRCCRCRCACLFHTHTHA